MRKRSRVCKAASSAEGVAVAGGWAVDAPALEGMRGAAVAPAPGEGSGVGLPAWEKIEQANNIPAMARSKAARGNLFLNDFTHTTPKKLPLSLV